MMCLPRAPSCVPKPRMRTVLLLIMALSACSHGRPHSAMSSSSTQEETDASQDVPEDDESPGGAFTSKGRLPQIEYAMIAAAKHTPPCVCFRTRDSCLLLAARGQTLIGAGHGDDPSEASLMEGPSQSTLHTITPSLGCLCVGVGGDALSQVKLLRLEAQRYRATFGHDIPGRVLAQRLADSLQGKGQHARMRCPAVSTVLASWQAEAGPELYQVDPAGVVCRVAGVALGPDADAATTALESVVFSQGQMSTREGETDEDVWRGGWDVMVRGWPNLKGQERNVDVARVGRRGFAQLGTLDRLLSSKRK